jgi:hypothetical protein
VETAQWAYCVCTLPSSIPPLVPSLFPFLLPYPRGHCEMAIAVVRRLMSREAIVEVVV